MPRASDVPCIRAFVSGSLSEERAHWRLHIGVFMVAGTLHRATALDSICPEKEILTAIVAGLLRSRPRGVVKNLKYVHGYRPESVKARQSSS